jgi:Mg2+/Co2+ transporter CorB
MYYLFFSALLILIIILSSFASGQEMAMTNYYRHHHLRGSTLTEFESMAERFYDLQKTERDRMTNDFIKYNPNYPCIR